MILGNDFGDCFVDGFGDYCWNDLGINLWIDLGPGSGMILEMFVGLFWGYFSD